MIETGRAEAEKEQIKRLISNMSHQLKTPLANIVMYEDILLDKLILREGMVEKYYLSSLKKQVQVSIEGAIHEENKIIIKNYDNPEEISLDEEIRNLYYQSRRLELNFGEKKAFIISRARKKE